jgi:hypothetical protein
MKFSFEVGQNEKHQIEFQWSKWLGVAKIWVDGTFIQKSRLLAFSELAQLGLLATQRGVRVRTTLPILKDGNTIGIHFTAIGYTVSNNYD